MFRSRVLRQVASPASQLSSQLNVLAVDGTTVSARSSVSREARDLVKSTKIDPVSLTPTLCTDILHSCSMFHVPAGEPMVASLAMWLGENMHAMSTNEIVEFTQRIRPDHASFWRAVLGSAALGDGLRGALEKLNPAQAVSVGRSLHSARAENHPAFRQALIAARSTSEPGVVAEIAEVFGKSPAVANDVQSIVEKCAQRLTDSERVQFVARVVTHIAQPCALVDPCVRLVGTPGSDPSAHIISETVAMAMMYASNDVAEDLSRVVSALTHRSEFSLEDIMSLAERAVSAGAPNDMIRMIAEAGVARSCETAQDRCAHVLLFGLADRWSDAQRVAAQLDTRNLPPDSAIRLLEADHLRPLLQPGPRKTVLASLVRNKPEVKHVCATLFYMAAADTSDETMLRDAVASLTSRSRFQRSRNVAFGPREAFRSLYGLSKLRYQYPAECSLQAFLLGRAVATHLQLSTSECAALLPVAAESGEVGAPLFRALSQRLRSAVPSLSLDNIAQVAIQFCKCKTRDVALFTSLVKRVEVPGATPDQTLAVLEAVHELDLRSLLTKQLMKKLHSKFAEAPVKQLTKFAMIATECGVDVRVAHSAAKDFHDEVSSLIIAPCRSGVAAVATHATARNADALFEAAGQSERKVVRAMLGAMTVDVDAATCAAALHNLVMCVKKTIGAVEVSSAAEVIATCAGRKLRVGSVFRLFGRHVATNASGLSAGELISVLEAYSALGIRDDFILRKLVARGLDLRNTLDADPNLRRRFEAAKKVLGGGR